MQIRPKTFTLSNYTDDLEKEAAALRTSWLWRITAAAGLLSTLLLLYGLIYAVNDILNPTVQAINSDPSAHQADQWDLEDGYLDIVGIGDSLTLGTGDATGAGYIGQVKTKLTEATGLDVRLLNNLAVNGYRTDQLLADLDKQSVQHTLKRADLILFTIGGNDLFKFVREELDVDAKQLSAEELRRSIPEPSERLSCIMKRLREINSNAIIVYIGLYNPFLDLDPDRLSSQAIAEWNAYAAAYAFEYPDVLMVPTADLFELSPQRYLYTDHFHPNTAGYIRIAERVVQALY